MDKKELRAKLKSIRASIQPGTADELIRNSFLNNVHLPEKSVVATYIPANSEIDVGKLNKALGYSGHKLCLPCVMGGKMLFREWGINTELTTNKFGLKEPSSDSQILKPEFVIVPILGFNKQKYRIGYGGGYYDRYLENSIALKIGVAYSLQEVPENFQEMHDIALDLIITEKSVYK